MRMSIFYSFVLLLQLLCVCVCMETSFYLYTLSVCMCVKYANKTIDQVYSKVFTVLLLLFERLCVSLPK